MRRSPWPAGASRRMRESPPASPAGRCPGRATCWPCARAWPATSASSTRKMEARPRHRAGAVGALPWRCRGRDHPPVQSRPVGLPPHRAPPRDPARAARPGAVLRRHARLIAHAGDDVFPVLGDVRCRDELRHRTGSRAIPAALALDALADARPLPLDRAIELRNWSLGSGGSGPDLSHCAGARVCDWAAAQAADH